MTKIGFNTGVEDKEDIFKSNHIENYEHIIKFLGIPLIKITKYHKIDSKKVGKE